MYFRKYPFWFTVGRTYYTKIGTLVTIVGRTHIKGYECVKCSDGMYRYDRSTNHSDAGRVTGTDTDNPLNLIK